MANKSSSNSQRHPYLRADKERLKFWLRKKVHDREDKDFRAASEDLPISDLMWRYNVLKYENS